MTMNGDYESGVYCKHWLEPGTCVECAKELCDYAALAAENEGLRACLERIHKAADEGSADPVLFRVQIRAQAREALSRKAAP